MIAYYNYLLFDVICRSCNEFVLVVIDGIGNNHFLVAIDDMILQRPTLQCNM
jgi:hypothetical protein